MGTEDYNLRFTWGDETGSTVSYTVSTYTYTQSEILNEIIFLARDLRYAGYFETKRLKKNLAFWLDKLDKLNQN